MTVDKMVLLKAISVVLITATLLGGVGRLQSDGRSSEANINFARPQQVLYRPRPHRQGKQSYMEPTMTAMPASSKTSEGRDSLPADDTREPNDGCHLLETAPREVFRACAYFRPDMREMLGIFFGKPKGTIRLAFFDAERRPAIGKTMDLSSCSARLNRTVEQHGRTSSSDYAQKFGAEVLVPRGLRWSVSGHVIPVTNAAEADYILVELCNIGRTWSGHTLRELAPHIGSDKTVANLWQKQRPRFLITLTGDHGPCVQSSEKIGQFRTRAWIDEAVRGATMLLNEGSTQGGCYVSGKDVVIPTSAVLVEQGSLRCSSRNTMSRQPLVFFAGKLDSKVRHRVVELINHPDFFVPHNLTGEDYLCAMSASTFCLAPRGNAAWSPRLDEALHAGCIPVILADSYEPPFSRMLDYNTFSITLSESQVVDGTIHLVRFLAAISHDRIRSMRAAGLAVRPFFRYRAYVPQPLVENSRNDAIDQGADATWLIAFELWHKLQTTIK